MSQPNAEVDPSARSRLIVGLEIEFERVALRLVCLLLAIALCSSGMVLAGETGTEIWSREIKPVLKKRCVGCHGALQQKAGLRLDTAQLLARGGDSGSIIDRADPAASELIQRLQSNDPAIRMPPEGEPLSADEISSITAWITSGAEAPVGEQPQLDPRNHWAFQAPQRKSIPQVRDRLDMGSLNHPIDAFLAEQRIKLGTQRVPEISRELWLRRVTLDLTGLPPSPTERTEFLADQSPAAYETVVDRLLASPAYGERWGRHWMDVWRYTDWYGLGTELRFSHYHIWRWRDWIVESLNSNVGYDRMIELMLAGDELDPENPQSLRATGFLVRNWDIFNRNKWLDNTIEHTAKGFLGLTLQCARCHDHKFDPLSQKEYYQFRAFFEPYQIRIDRIPGQPDRNKDGIARVFDDFLETPTVLYLRGDETQPDAKNPLHAAVPASLGGTIEIRSVQLPVSAHNPDKRAFIVEEARATARQRVAELAQALQQAESQLDTAKGAHLAANEAVSLAENAAGMAKPEELAAIRQTLAQKLSTALQAEQAVSAAMDNVALSKARLQASERSLASIEAVLKIEALEDAGGKEQQPAEWTTLAQATVATQRESQLADALVAVETAAQQVSQLQATLAGLQLATRELKNDSLKDQINKTENALAEARLAHRAAQQQKAQAEAAIALPLTTAYQPRQLEFPRAKITYRDTPSTAPYSKVSTGRRTALARWITDANNPLTARVAVNHIWARHFGTPLATSTFDFGLRTPPPRQQDLLDWLAVEFRESGWNMKQLHRLIVTSQAYRLQSWGGTTSSDSTRRDPDNTTYWRMNPRRMEAEVIRDSLLALSGRLDITRGGPDIPTAAAETGLRRSLYYRYSRDDRMQFLTIFDGANAEECYLRAETVVPQQALALSNSQLVLDRADDIADAIRGEKPDMSSNEFVSRAFERVLGRSASKEEMTETLAGVDEFRRLETETPHNPPSARSIEQRVASSLIHVLLNHNDFVMIR